MKRFILLCLMLTTSVLVFAENWHISLSEDEMTGDKSVYVMSNRVTATKAMAFPYDSTECSLCIGMDSKDTWVYFYFTSQPNLLDTDTKDGYNLVKTRIKFDSEVENVKLTQTWGANSIHFIYPESILPKIEDSSEILIELKWHGCGKVYFKLPVSELEGTIAEARSML